MSEALKKFAALFTPPWSESGGRIAIPSLTGSADAFVAMALAGESQFVLAVTAGIPEAERLTDDLRIVSAKTPVRILELPPKVDGDRSALGERLKTISAIRAWSINPYPIVIVASYAALATTIPEKAAEPIHIDTRKPEQSLTALAGRFADFGYRRVPQVEQPGDFSVRGCILDAWSPGEEFPMRAEFFGDELESIRSFDPLTQISIERAEISDFYPISEKESTASAATFVPGTDPANALKNKGLGEILPMGAIILALDHNEYNLWLGLGTAGETVDKGFRVVYAGEPAPAGVATYGFQTVALPGFSELGSGEAHHPELFDNARRRLEQHIAAAGKRGDEVFKIDELSGGFEVVHSRDSTALLVVTKSDRVFAKRKARKSSNAGGGVRLNDFDTLEPGEYVVHIDHGIGRYIGSSEILTDGKRTEVFTIEYADGAKLHVPAAHAHLLSRYVGVKGEAVRLHRLDGRRWTKDKADAQKAVADLAVALLETQARRAIVPGFAYDVECEGLTAFEAAFPYEETEDQSAAIAAVKRDLAASKPMDRLICGDAGYGKTEVAMRAAYIAAMNGKQVAVLAPTTVLAEQHFETFTSRFDGTPVRIESVSRFQGSATHSGTFRRLATGACDIVIGTHALLSSKICFHDLGLIIIDEEQRFGVRHKEFLKRLRATADVLTLSATPIPRTLYLSMTGARDLSLLRTPPRERVAVDTRIVTDSDETIRHAIDAELARGGQVFFLHNRVSTIGKVEKRLKEIFNSAIPHSSFNTHHPPRIVVAHGQMDSRTLARKMRDFERGEHDILLSTTIVESGIDIPRANTIIVDHAENFGLADLYQLRGRVGRSSKEGHAIFLLPDAGLVDSDARERLNALKRHGGLGSGFNLAVRDLELRGAGNLLGSQQSGHIAAVGFGLYCQLLQRTISSLKGERQREIVDVKLALDFMTPNLPYQYIEEDAIRLSLIRRFAEAQDERIAKALETEMKDRFGPLPEEATLFVKASLLRIRAAQAGIGFIDVKGPRAIAYSSGSRKIMKVIDLKGHTAKRKLEELLRGI